MNATTRTLSLQGQAGHIEALLDEPAEGAVQGTVVIAHPHPLFGGTMQNKVVQTLARSFVQSRWRAVRFNFRGVGASQGTYDEGRGEATDMLQVISTGGTAGSFGTGRVFLWRFCDQPCGASLGRSTAAAAPGAGGHGSVTL